MQGRKRVMRGSLAGGDGRAKPVDTLARHNLLAISSKQTFLDASEKRQPAVKWFLDLIATPRSGASYHVIRVENLEVHTLQSYQVN